VNRRGFIVGAAAAGGGLGLAVIAARLAGVWPSGAAALDPAALVGAGPGVQAIGRAYLELEPREADADRLLELILGDAPASRVLERVRLDFTEGRTVRLHGFILSRMEARLCALAALRA
jgi:hypothetical protein